MMLISKQLINFLEKRYAAMKPNADERVKHLATTAYINLTLKDKEALFALFDRLK